VVAKVEQGYEAGPSVFRKETLEGAARHDREVVAEGSERRYNRSALNRLGWVTIETPQGVKHLLDFSFLIASAARDG
jgi:hypothetical protein